MSVVDAKKPCQRLFKIKAAGVYLSTSPRKLRDMIHRGELPTVRFGEGSPYLLDVRDLDALIDRYKRIA